MSVLTQDSVSDEINYSADGKDQQFLTFLIADEEYGVDILRVQEIRGWERATPIPNTADYVRGLINLRGAVVPVIDLRRRFGKQPIEYTNTTVVIVVKILSDKTEKTIGLVVDAVSDVRKASNDQLRPAPDFGTGDQGLVKGLATVKDALIILLDVDKLMSFTF